jgi:hypothetical protein
MRTWPTGSAGCDRPVTWPAIYEWRQKFYVAAQREFGVREADNVYAELLSDT